MGQEKVNKKIVKNKPLTKKQVNDLIDAWAGMNNLAVYLKDMKEHPENFAKDMDLYGLAHDIYKKLDSIVSKLPD